ncbi:fluoride efflux transporter CrcB [Psychroflexus montanilacus]|uniref:fluoride efflux transporter CrcB n=1 Tax=Psychroflexus montanilacus TaxID=2873598 RepID=UPI001CCBEF88|nr:fluoride efflux transporter CrcB [Psychroflexus montanilacus]MBZ9651941.1 fluoride efflux transporter CrcB [Psychroflexus montanilacus]
MKSALLVFLGGGLGSLARYWISIAMKHQIDSKIDVYGTLTVNVIGSLLIGLLMGWLLKSETSYPNLELLLVVGFCGGFTTFSTFSSENLNLLKNNLYTEFLLYGLGSLLLGILAVFIGVLIIKKGF